MQLVRALALRLHLKRASPLTPLHIAGVDNAMTNIPSRSFGSEKKWHCKTDNDFLTLFNTTFPLPNQASWTLYRPSSAISTRLISILRMKVFMADGWRRLPPSGKSIGTVGSPTPLLWEWTLTYRRHATTKKHAPCQDSPLEFDQAAMVEESKSVLARSLALSRPLARQYPWPAV